MVLAIAYYKAGERCFNIHLSALKRKDMYGLPTILYLKLTDISRLVEQHELKHID